MIDAVSKASVSGPDPTRHELDGEIMRRDDILRMFLSGKGQWSGCDWPTQFGATGLNLCALTAAQALLMARATAGVESADWRAAAQWLAEVETAARQAEASASQAALLAAEG